MLWRGFSHHVPWVRGIERFGGAQGLKSIQNTARIREAIMDKNKNFMCLPCQHVCPFCGHRWILRKLNPLRCPCCKRKLDWEKR
jgi:rubrerythrin